MSTEPRGESTVPGDVLDLSGRFRALPGVLGVFWGHRQRAGQWTEEPCVSVHVREKRPLAALAEAERLPEAAGGRAVDVIEVGAIEALSIDRRSVVRAEGGPRPRVSTVTALTVFDDAVHALVSGHGSLPYAGGRIRSRYDAREHPRAGIRIVESSGRPHPGELVRGQLGAQSPLDFAVVRLSSPPEEVDFEHPAAGPGPRWPLLGHDPEGGQIVQHYSRVLGRLRRGRLRQVAATAADVDLPDGATQGYSASLVVDALDGEAFSRPGDSGSLVTDREGRVFGAVFAGSTCRPISYVLPIKYLAQEIGPIYWSFFRGSDG